MEQWIRDLLTPTGALVIFNIGFFIAWYFTFKRANDQQDKARKEIADLFTSSDKKYTDTNSTIIQLLKDEQEYKLLVAGILDRLVEKLEKPIVCPLALSEKGGRS